MRTPRPHLARAATCRSLAVSVLAATLVACGSETTTTTDSGLQVATTAVTTTSDAPAESAPRDTPAPPTAPPTTGAPTTAAPETTDAVDPADGVVRIAVDVTGGDVVTDDDRVDVPLGATVELTVSTDVVDEVHVHGYDLFGGAAPGLPAVVTFVADIPGVFEVELEGTHQLLVELQVS